MPSRTALVVDLGGTSIRVAVVREDGVMLAVERRSTPQGGPDAVMSVIGEAIGIVLERAGGQRPVAVGATAPGLLDPRTGVVFETPNLLGWKDVEYGTRLAQIAALPAFVHNDANLAALGEARLGSGRGFDPLLYLTVSTGVGGGLILGGRIFEGAHGLAGEFGHVIVRDGGPRSSAGHSGSLEALASGTAIALRAREMVAAGVETALARHADAGIDASAVARAAESGDELAIAIYREAGRALGLAIGSFVNILDPARVVIGGGVSHAWSLWADEAMDAARSVVMAGARRSFEVVPATLGDDAGLIGAAFYALMHV